MRTSTLTLAAIAVSLTCTLSASADAAQRRATATVMRPNDVRALYAGKTWIWSDGAAYFAPNRRFVAWSGSGKQASYAEGEWRVTPLGRMCFSAIWRGVGPSGRNITCFGHRVMGGQVIYQQKEPGGAWYVFKHGQTAAGDEYAKFRAGDEASAGVGKVKQELKLLSARS
ncbi:protein of unknown function DUF995 [Ancylobacter novellus DSM 506]|uniref:DUF995 domain-containing protein n=1 Tax=Ancylobacter novellus (strain ATCC 8093 / DSM 506 / JCM 20403 / CCM 1077 / IAM 12100 / NBRC 12443 / NCIMB 10456) TaxID=639283 RepID=D7A469_ANCN5|nr:DUF995 domain-containing protein [Ancylobacter novellus]ADH87889.1 protein of unknown function DUF995 [Ancylobacter novellus DSM 506]